MASAREVMETIQSGLVPVPATPQEGVCASCHSSCGVTYSVCNQCRTGQHRAGAIDLLPISMSVHAGLLHRQLWIYKNGDGEELRAQAAYRLAALVSVFVEEHQACLGEFDVAAALGSQHRTAPLAIANRLRAMNGRVEPTLEAGETDAEGFREYRLLRSVEGERVLLFDDTFTSGRTMFSAVAALRSGGATVVGPLVIGRHFQPDFPLSKPMWSWLRSRRWDAQRCARCDGERRDPGQLL